MDTLKILYRDADRTPYMFTLRRYLRLRDGCSEIPVPTVEGISERLPVAA